jgi:tetratricopeptide (TPR) repeat protein
MPGRNSVSCCKTSRSLSALLAYLACLLAALPPTTAFAAPEPQEDAAAPCVEGLKLAEAGRIAAAIPLLEAGVAGAARAPMADQVVLLDCALQLGTLLEAQSRFAEALAAYGQAREAARVQANGPAEMAILGSIFTLYNTQRYFREALETALQMEQIGRDIREQTGDPRFESIALLFTMMVYVGQWRCSEALPLGQHVIELSGGDRRTNLASTVDLYTAECAYYQQRYDEAGPLYQRTAEVSRANGNLAMELLALDGVAKIRRIEQRYDEALGVLQQAVQRGREAGDRSSEANLLGSIADLYREQGRYDEALSVLQEALQLARDQRDKSEEGFLRLEVGRTYSDQAQHDEALESFYAVAALARELQLPDLEGAALTYISREYEAQQRLQEALAVRLDAIPYR